LLVARHFETISQKSKRQKKLPPVFCGSFFAVGGQYRLAAAASELALELVNTTGGVNKAFFARVCRVGIRGNVARNHAIFDAVDDFLFLRGKRRRREELTSRGNVAEANKINGRMEIFLHNILSFSQKGEITRKINPGALCSAGAFY